MAKSKTEQTKEIIRPACGAWIDFNEFFKRAQIQNPHEDLEFFSNWSESDRNCWLQKGFEYLFDELFKKYSKGKKEIFRNKNLITYTMKQYECFLRIYLHNGSVSYFVRLDTVNTQQTVECCWYCNEMPYDDTGIFISALNDFSELVDLCSTLCVAFEHNSMNTFGFIPRGTYKPDGSWFCNMTENKILMERHYYQGYIDYEHDRCKVSFDWDDMLEKCKVK